MKYIEKIILKNFQSHKHTVLKFDNGLNIIVGPSDSGKTSILRGLKWVLYNEPLGDYFIREGESNCSVAIEFNNGVKIERYRDKSKNQYNIYIGDEVETFEGFGSGVPLEVAEAMGITKLELDNKETRGINLAEQLDGPFLISEKPSIKASSIGRLVGANIVDDALKESLKDNRNLGIKKNTLIEENKILEEEIEEFKYLEDFEKKIKILEDISWEIKIKDKKKKVLVDKYKMFLEIKNNLDKNRDILMKLESLKNLEKYVNKMEFGLFKYNNLSKINIKIKDIFKDKNYQEKIINLTRNIDETKKQTNILDRNIIEYNKLSKINIKIKDIFKDKNYQEKIMDLTGNIDETKKQTDILDRNIIEYNRSINEKQKLKRLKKEKEIVGDKIYSLGSIESIDIRFIKEKCDLITDILRKREIYIINQKNITKGRDFVNKLDGIDKSLEAVNNLEIKYNIKYTLENIIAKYKENQNAIKKGKVYIEGNDKSILNYLNEYKNELENSEICPLCFTELNKKNIDRIINTFMEDFNI